MTRTLTLEDFSSDAPLARTVVDPAMPSPDASPPEPQADALDAFDNGYKSGWSDCAAAEAEERRGIGADLARNLSDAVLTYETARRDVLGALAPLLDDIVTTLLPRLAAEAVLPCVLAEIDALGEGQTRSGIVLHAAPSSCPALERLVEVEGIEGLVIHPEPAFAEGQVSLRLGPQRRDIDMASATERIADAISGFLTHSLLADPVQPTLTQGAA